MSTTWHSSLTTAAVRMTSNTTPSPYVASASNEVDADHAAWKAFSGDVNFEWMTADSSGPPWWLQFDWGPFGPDLEPYASFAGFPAVGVIGIFYLALDTNLVYRWNGSGYIPSTAPRPAQILTSYVIGEQAFFGINFYQRCPQDWLMQGSNGGSVWTTIDTVTGQTNWPASPVRRFVCDDQTKSYRYFRLYIAANGGAPWPTIVVVGSLDLGGQGNKFY